MTNFAVGPLALILALTSSAIAQEPAAYIAPSPAWTQAMPSGPVARTKITESYATLVARDAYFWAWPLVNMHNRRLANEPVKQFVRAGPVPSAPINHVAMLTDYIDPGERLAVCPNQDVVYGIGFFALEKTPVVIQVPEFGNRFWVFAAYNTRTRQRLLVADALQRPPLLRAQSDQALLARHQEQDAEARPRRVADDLRAGRFAGRGQGIELATRAKGRRLLTLWARVLAEARDHRRLLDAAAREAGGVSRAGICGGAMQTHHRGIAAILLAAGQRGAGRERWSHVRRSWRWPVSARPSS
jgi:Protein of unknown function (DUF1254)